MSFLQIEHLSRSYGDIPAVREFSLDVTEGDICALVGPDGAGKTTILRIVCGLMAADSGAVRVNGQDVLSSLDQVKAILGYMPQQFSLYPDLSVEENLTFYAGLYGISGSAYIEKRDYLYTFSNLGPFAGRRAGALSGGMKQKLALSCALMHDPRILVLDEPTTGVDPLSRRQFWEILQGLKEQGSTILVSTPYMDEVDRCDRACFVFDGVKLSEGTPAELTSQYAGSIFYLDREPTTELVTRLNAIGDLNAARFGAGLHISLPEGQALERYGDQLRAISIPLTDFSPIAPGLEDRFIQLMEVHR
ncbi:MAG: ABC transporter ATP-binding protein [candidate division Zixibacteria bacterium]|nr:ABC transporter ATP-binding protein [candidate division Zixibacteria bacterium]